MEKRSPCPVSVPPVIPVSVSVSVKDAGPCHHHTVQHQREDSRLFTLAQVVKPEAWRAVVFNGRPNLGAPLMMAG